MDFSLDAKASPKLDPIVEDINSEDEPMPDADNTESADDDHLNSSILSFQQFLHADPEPQEVSDSHSDSSESDNAGSDSNSESDEEPSDELIDKKLRQLMPRKPVKPRRSPRKGSTKKPGPKLQSRNRVRRSSLSSSVPNANEHDPRTCGTYHDCTLPTWTLSHC